MRNSRPCVVAALAIGLFGRAHAQSLLIHPRVFNDVPASTFTSSSTSNSVSLSDSSVVSASGYANRHDWRISDNGTSDKVFGPTDYFDLSADLTLTANPVSPRKEAGIRINSSSGDSLFIVDTDAHEITAFGGAFPTYDFRAHSVTDFVSGNTLHMRIQYLQQGGVNGFILTAGTVVSPFLPAANTGKAIYAGSTVGGYFQIQKATTAPNGGSATFTNIAYQSGLPTYLAISDDVLLDRTEAQACLYANSMLVTTPAATGFPSGRAMIADSSTSSPQCSCAATGFGLVCLAIEAQRYGTTSEWTVTPVEARAKANAILDTILELQSGPAQYAGLPYHWTQPTYPTGPFVRYGGSEVSTVDTAYMVLGALAAGQAFGGEVKAKALHVASNVNWDAFIINSGGVPRISMAWQPKYDSSSEYTIPAGSGYLLQSTWDRVTDEILTIAVLASGNDPTNAELLSTFYSWPRTQRSYQGSDGTSYSLIPSYFGSMFTYTQAHGLLPLQQMGVDHPEDVGGTGPAIDWWANAVTAAQASRQFSADHAAGQTPADGNAAHASFGPDSWGLTAAFNPSSPYDYKGLLGSPPREANGGKAEAEGIIAPYGAISAMPLMRTSPNEALSDNAGFRALRHYYDGQAATLWSSFGPKEAFDDSGAVAQMYVGIDAPLEAICIEAYRTGETYTWTALNQPIADGLAVIFHRGFSPGDMDLDGAVTVSDAIVALQIAAGFVVATPAQRYNGDLNGDGTVSLQDAVAIARKAAGG
jgi:hypothetical protein